MSVHIILWLFIVCSLYCNLIIHLFDTLTDPPEIEIERDTVTTAEGYESELICHIHAVPKAKVNTLIKE